MKKRLYLAYGANMCKTSMKLRSGANAVGPIMLRGWELKFYAHATIEPCAGATVPGVLWEIDTQTEELLDMYECYPHYYVKRNLEQDGQKFFVYVMTSEQKYGTPSQSYTDNMAKAYAEWGLPLAA